MSESAAFKDIPFDDDADEVKTWKGLALSAIMDLRRYAHDAGPERRMVSAEAYEADAERIHAHAPAARTPVAWANGDELDNMLDDRTATVSGKPDGFRRTPLFKECEGRASPSPSDFYDHGALYVYDGTSQTFDPYVHPSTASNADPLAQDRAHELADEIMSQDLMWMTSGFFLSDDDSIMISDALRAATPARSAATSDEAASVSMQLIECTRRAGVDDYTKTLLLHASMLLDATPAPPASTDLREALRDLLNHVDRETCTHDETHRGGSIWTICDGCGRKWADDEGGFKPHCDAPAVAVARAALTAPAAALSPPRNDRLPTEAK